MNIFVSDSSPIKSAEFLDDKRVKHMPKECIELTSMAYYINTGISIYPFIIWNREHRTTTQKFEELFYNKCTRWVSASRENMWWLWQHSIALLDEYRYRFNSVHYLFQDFQSISHYIPETKHNPKSFANASGFDEKDIFLSYRKCLNYKWFVTDEIKPNIWTKRGIPSWANNEIEIKQQELFQIDMFDDLPF